MAEQQSRRSNNVTAATFESPFETHTVRYGAGSLNLKDSLDTMEGWSRLTNIWHENEGEATTRPGQTALATHGAGTTCHSIRQLRDPGDGTRTRFWGVGTAVHQGDSGATTPRDTGYSGHPLTFLPHHPPLSGEPWMLIADSQRMRKVRGDGLVLPIGLPQPTAPPTIARGIEYGQNIVRGDASDGTEPANWVPVAGTDATGIATGVPAAMVPALEPFSGFGVYGITNPGSGVTSAAYDSWWGCHIARDLTVLDQVTAGPGPATKPATDDDLIHVWLKTSHPAVIAEMRLYLVCSPDFDPAILPGTAISPTDPANTNQDAFVKAFRPNDYVQFVAGKQAQAAAAEQARIYALRDADSKSRGFNDGRDSWQTQMEGSDPARARSFQIGLGTQQWFMYGAVGSPFRRGDFQRIGSAADRGWDTITGVIFYVRTAVGSDTGPIAVALADCYMTGGADPDTAEPGVQQYDYRVTNYDPRTGAESNGSDAQDVTVNPAAFIDSLRRAIDITPPAYGDPAIRQKIYRRGGTNIDDWYYVDTNSADGALYTDVLGDLAIATAGFLPTDNYQPVPTIDDAGNTVLAQPVPALWGPLEGMLFACGDPYRPGFLYFSVADEPDHWSAFGNTEVCPPSEELMHGGMIGHQGFVFSRSKLYFIYPNLGRQYGINVGLTVTPALCTRGLNLSRFAFVAGPAGAVYFVCDDGVFATDGGPEVWLSEAINPLFYGNAVNGYQPIDKTATDALRLAVWENALYFQYQDTSGQRQVLVYSLLQKFWRHYHFGQSPACLQGDDEPYLLIGGNGTGKSYTLTGTSDDGTAIPATIRPGSFSGGRREEKLFGDIFLDVDCNATPLTLQVFLNEETHANSTIAVSPPGPGRQRILVNAFGDSPQKAHSITCDLSYSTSGAGPTLYQIGYAMTLQPDLTNARVTNWDDCNSPDEVWLTGVTFDCDTGGVSKTVNIEIDFAGTRTVIATFDVLTAGRHKVKFSWPAVSAHMVRIRPDPGCAPWLLYRADWIYVDEPPRISKWDIHFENKWDSYYTGLDLYCDTFGTTKHIEVWVDETRLINSLGGGLTYWPVTTNGRRVVHLTLPWGRGHVYRFLAVDDNPGLLYTHRWHLQEEPSEQSNWNQNFTTLGTHADKWLKAVIFECDTFGQDKSVQVEVDGGVVATLTVNTTGRRVVQLTLPTQQLGRVWRIFPVDGNPGRLYSAEPIFDEEPFCFDRWETQETNHNLPGWFYPLYGHITLKSTSDVTLQTVMQYNQVGDTVTNSYIIPATGGQKQRRFLSFLAGKGVLIKYLLTSSVPFFLYRDETSLIIQPWGAYESIQVKPFGNDDQDPSRPMTHSVLAAEASGGASSATGGVG